MRPLSFGTYPHQPDVLMHCAYTYRVCATSPSKNTFFRSEISKLGETNLCISILRLEWFIRLSEITENKAFLYLFSCVLNFHRYKVIHAWHHMTYFIRPVPFFHKYNGFITQCSPRRLWVWCCQDSLFSDHFLCSPHHVISGTKFLNNCFSCPTFW